jgi:RNA polymerase-binding transcription factor DksA
MTEHMADEIDRANHLAELATQDSVAHYRRLAAPEQDPDNLDPYCADCGDEIEDARLLMFRMRCFGCQSAKEKREKQHAR